MIKKKIIGIRKAKRVKPDSWGSLLRETWKRTRKMNYGFKGRTCFCDDASNDGGRPVWPAWKSRSDFLFWFDDSVQNLTRKQMPLKCCEPTFRSGWLFHNTSPYLSIMSQCILFCPGFKVTWIWDCLLLLLVVILFVVVWILIQFRSNKASHLNIGKMVFSTCVSFEYLISHWNLS